jgi:hypothetical protein
MNKRVVLVGVATVFVGLAALGALLLLHGGAQPVPAPTKELSGPVGPIKANIYVYRNGRLVFSADPVDQEWIKLFYNSLFLQSIQVSDLAGSTGPYRVDFTQATAMGCYLTDSGGATHDIPWMNTEVSDTGATVVIRHTFSAILASGFTATQVSSFLRFQDAGGTGQHDVRFTYNDISIAFQGGDNVTVVLEISIEKDLPFTQNTLYFIGKLLGVNNGFTVTATDGTTLSSPSLESFKFALSSTTASYTVTTPDIIVTIPGSFGWDGENVTFSASFTMSSTATVRSFAVLGSDGAGHDYVLLLTPAREALLQAGDTVDISGRFVMQQS